MALSLVKLRTIFPLLAQIEDKWELINSNINCEILQERCLGFEIWEHLTDRRNEKNIQKKKIMQ